MTNIRQCSAVTVLFTYLFYVGLTGLHDPVALRTYGPIGPMFIDGCVSTPIINQLLHGN